MRFEFELVGDGLKPRTTGRLGSNNKDVRIGSPRGLRNGIKQGKPTAFSEVHGLLGVNGDGNAEVAREKFFRGLSGPPSGIQERFRPESRFDHGSPFTGQG